MEILPKILNFTEFKVVSYYDYLYLNQCILKGMKKNISFDNLLPDTPPTKPILVGRFHHKIMEYLHTVATLSEFQNTIENEIASLQHEIMEWPHFKNSGSVRGWVEINKSASFALRAFKNKAQVKELRNTKIESSLISKDNTLIGRPDLFSIKENMGFIKELKSSNLFDSDGILKVEYYDQLIFYAILLFDNYVLESIDALLESLHGETYKVTISKEEAEISRRTILMNIKIANEKIRNTINILDIAYPSQTACRGCQKRIICKEYKINQLSLNLNGDEFVLDGFLISINNNTQQGISQLNIHHNYLNKIFIIYIPNNKALDLKPNYNYLFSNLSIEKHGYVWTNKSRIYSYD